MKRTLLVGLLLATAFTTVLPSAAATHVPICWGVGQAVEIDWVDGNPVCAVDCVWDVLTGARFKELGRCLRHVTG